MVRANRRRQLSIQTIPQANDVAAELMAPVGGLRADGCSGCTLIFHLDKRRAEIVAYCMVHQLETRAAIVSTIWG